MSGNNNSLNDHKIGKLLADLNKKAAGNLDAVKKSR